MHQQLGPKYAEAAACYGRVRICSSTQAWRDYTCAAWNWTGSTLGISRKQCQLEMESYDEAIRQFVVVCLARSSG